MKLLIDQNISYKVAQVANEYFSGSVHVGKIGLSTALDKEIIDYAIKDNYTIVSKYRDFVEYVSFNGSPPKVIILKTGNTSTDYLINLINRNKLIIKDFISDLDKDILEIS